MAGKQSQLSVLVFGDSLTTGTIFGSASQPYGNRLATLLGTSTATVSVNGWAGQCATDMTRRLQEDLSQKRPRPYTHVVLLAGTNDLRSGALPAALLCQLRVLHSMIRAAGAKCVAVTIPQLGPTDAATVPLTEQRDFVNKALRDEAAASLQGNLPPIWLADFDAELAKLPAAERKALFSDSCHFTSSGYDLLADLVHKTILVSLHERAESPAPAKTVLGALQKPVQSLSPAKTVLGTSKTPTKTVLGSPQEPAKPTAPIKTVVSIRRQPVVSQAVAKTGTAAKPLAVVSSRAPAKIGSAITTLLRRRAAPEAALPLTKRSCRFLAQTRLVPRVAPLHHTVCHRMSAR